MEIIDRIRNAVKQAETGQLEEFLSVTQIGDTRKVIRRMRQFAAGELARRDVEKEQDEL